MPELAKEKESRIGEWIATGFFIGMGGALFVGLLELGRRVIRSAKDKDNESEEDD